MGYLVSSLPLPNDFFDALEAESRPTLYIPGGSSTWNSTRALLTTQGRGTTKYLWFYSKMEYSKTLYQ